MICLYHDRVDFWSSHLNRSTVWVPMLQSACFHFTGDIFDTFLLNVVWTAIELLYKTDLHCRTDIVSASSSHLQLHACLASPYIPLTMESHCYTSSTAYPSALLGRQEFSLNTPHWNCLMRDLHTYSQNEQPCYEFVDLYSVSRQVGDSCNADSMFLYSFFYYWIWQNMSSRCHWI